MGPMAEVNHQAETSRAPRAASTHFFLLRIFPKSIGNLLARTVYGRRPTPFLRNKANYAAFGALRSAVSVDATSSVFSRHSCASRSAF